MLGQEQLEVEEPAAALVRPPGGAEAQRRALIRRQSDPHCLCSTVERAVQCLLEVTCTAKLCRVTTTVCLCSDLNCVDLSH